MDDGFRKRIVRFFIEKMGIVDNDFQCIKGDLYNLQQRYTILCVIDSAWNTVECMLPAMVCLKRYESCNLIVLFWEDNLWNKIKDERSSFEQVYNIADAIIVNKNEISKIRFNFCKKARLRFKWALLKNTLDFWLNKIYIDVVWRVWNPSFVGAYLYKSHPKAKHVVQGHAAFYGMVNEPVECGAFYKADMFLFTDSYAYRGISNKILKKMKIVGAPKYDLWWRCKLRKRYNINLLTKQLVQHKKYKILLLMPLLSDDERFDCEEYTAIIEFMIANADKYVYILKFHPRDTAVGQAVFFDRYKLDSKKIEIYVSKIEPLILSEVADCVVALGVTSATVDVLITGKPVIEFYKNEKRRCYYEWDNQQYGSFAKKYALTPYANSSVFLNQIVTDILLHGLWDHYKDRYKEYIPCKNDASKSTVKYLMQWKGELPDDDA